MHASPLRTTTAVSILLTALVHCAEEPPEPGVQIDVTEAAPAASDEERRAGPPTAVWEVVDLLRDAKNQRFAPSDGGGRAWLARDDDQQPFATSGVADRFTIIYETGPLGIATGGMLYFQVSPFWHWSTPQSVLPNDRGYTTVTPSDPAIELGTETLDQQLLGIQILGRPLAPGDRIEIVYGAGLAGALPDKYAERRSRFWIGVDGDGDGTRRFLVDSPAIDVHPGPAAGLLLHVPTVARPGETIRVTLAFVDAWRNAAIDVDREVQFIDPPDGIELPASVRFEASHAGRRSVEAVAREPGVYRLRAKSGEWIAESNPLVVASDGPRVLWGDLHGHSNFSDGTGLPDDYFAYARDTSGLDVAALTDHDHWGILPLVEHPDRWDEITRQARRFYEPGRFVTLLGYEWTSWIYGHRHVLYFGDEGEVFDSLDDDFATPQQLWNALDAGGWNALTFAHHSAGGPIATDWSIPPDPRFEPVTEIVSIHGSSEAFDSPGVIYDPILGNFVRDVLQRGYQFGFIGSGDRHDGHPGAYQPEPTQGGLAAILSEDRTREGVLAALRARRVYATNGPRILLRASVGAHPMGSVVELAEPANESLFVHVVAETPLDRIEMIRSGEIMDGVLVEGQLDVMLQRDVSDIVPGESIYVRAVQEDGGTAWSSPIYFVEAGE